MPASVLAQGMYGGGMMGGAVNNRPVALGWGGRPALPALRHDADGAPLGWCRAADLLAQREEPLKLALRGPGHDLRRQQTGGTYWHVCPTPGHAKKGMYGKFVVEGSS